jgi:hypothetical protein
MQFSFRKTPVRLIDVLHDALLLVHDSGAVAGWVGAVVVLAAYGLMVAGRMPATSGRYLAANAVGSLGLGISALQLHAWQGATVNVLWLLFGLRPLGRAVQRRLARGRVGAGRSYAPTATPVAAEV